MNLQQLKDELKEKEKNLKKIDKRNKELCEKFSVKNNLSYKKPYSRYSELKSEISALKKGIEACEEILMNKGNFNTSMNRKVCYGAGYKDAIEQRNKEILEIIDKIKNENSDDIIEEFELTEKQRYWVYVEELKKQLTNSEEK